MENTLSEVVQDVAVSVEAIESKDKPAVVPPDSLKTTTTLADLPDSRDNMALSENYVQAECQTQEDIGDIQPPEEGN